MTIYNDDQLQGLKGKELIAHINELTADPVYQEHAREVVGSRHMSALPLGPKAFSTKAKAIARVKLLYEQYVLILAAENFVASEETRMVEGTGSEEPRGFIEEATPEAAPETTKRTIQMVAEELILMVVDEAEFEGFPYKAILARVKEEFPAAKTTLNCLRWYASRLQATHQVPTRPRKSS